MVGTESKSCSLEDIVKEVCLVLKEGVYLVIVTVEVVLIPRKELLEGMATDDVARRLESGV